MPLSDYQKSRIDALKQGIERRKRDLQTSTEHIKTQIKQEGPTSKPKYMKRLQERKDEVKRLNDYDKKQIDTVKKG